MADKTELQRNIDGGYHGELMTEMLTYDFDKLGGSTSDTFYLGKLGTKMLVKAARVVVETACADSGGTAVVTIGYDNNGGETADADAILDATNGAIANLVDDAVFNQSAIQDVVLNADTRIDMAIATEDLTAGRIRVILEGYRVS